MRIPYGFNLVNNGVLEVKESEAINVRMIFDYYLAGASLGKVVDMLYAKQIPSPTGKEKWTRQLTTFSPTPSTSILSVLNPLPTRNLKKLIAAMSTMIRWVRQEKKPDMSHPLCLRCNFYSKFLQYLL